MKEALFIIAIFINFYAAAQNTIPQQDTAMILVKGGSFEMGSNNGLGKERPEHTISLYSFYICKYEVTQSLWQLVMGSNPSDNKGCAQCPVENVTPDSIDAFIKKINTITNHHYRLPTEAEWEYAAMGGNKSKGYTYSGSNSPAEVAWYKPNADNTTHHVGSKKPNELDIYDMTGNVWELCSDRYDKNYYRKSPAAEPMNSKAGTYQIVRGGSWRSMENRLYNKARNRNIPDHRKANNGFRLVMDVKVK